LRISDLLQLKIKDMFNDKGTYKQYISIREKKTSKEKLFVLNKAAQNAIEEFLETNREAAPEQYLFTSRKGENQPITRVQAWVILNDVRHALDIRIPIGTHTLRKTFGYHAYKQGTDIILLQKVFNHSAPSVTLRYIGITQDDINSVYINLNL